METERITVPAATARPALHGQLIRSRFAIKLTRYAIGSVAALLTSVIVFALLLGAGVGTTADSILAFGAGAVPNWILNRRWAWERTGELDVGRELVGYALISLLALAVSSAGTGWADAFLRHHLAREHALRVLLVTGTYVLAQALLFVAKFVAYDTWVFTEDGRFRAALSPRRAGRALAAEPAIESDSPA